MRNASDSCRSRPFPPERTQVEKGHGRLEERALVACAVAGAQVSFPFVRQVARVDRRREDLKTGKVGTETVWVVTSLEPERADPLRLAALLRAHWSIENQLHWRRDWSFDEDRSRITHPSGARVMASLRNLAIAWSANVSPFRKRVRQKSLPQQQRRVAQRLQVGVAALLHPWKRA